MATKIVGKTNRMALPPRNNQNTQKLIARQDSRCNPPIARATKAPTERHTTCNLGCPGVPEVSSGHAITASTRPSRFSEEPRLTFSPRVLCW